MGSSVLLPQPGQPTEGPDKGFVQAARPNIVTFGFEKISPPSLVYIQRDDVLLIQVGLGTTADNVVLNTRILLPFQPNAGQPDQPQGGVVPTDPRLGGSTIIFGQQILNAGAAPGVTLFTIPLMEGYLLSVSATAASLIQRGQVFVRGWLVRGGTLLNARGVGLPLFADYTTTFHPVGWPYGRNVFETEGPGQLFTATVTNPAAGADWSYVQANNSRGRVQSFAATLTTSATVASRIVRVQVTDSGAAVQWQGVAQANIPASTTAVVAGGPGQFTSTTDPTTQNVPLPGLVMLGAQWTIRVSTLNLQAGDQWSLIKFGIEQWLDLD